MEAQRKLTYQAACMRVVFSLLAVWFFVSFGCGIIFCDWLNVHAPPVGNAPFGFWMAQQGSIICFVLLLVIYAILMGRLDAAHGYSEKNK